MSSLPLILIALFVSGIVEHSKGASILVTNFNEAETNPVTNASGIVFPIGSGFVAIGALTDPEAAFMEMTVDHQLGRNLSSFFHQFGDALQFGHEGLPGVYHGVVTQSISENDAFDGQRVFTVIGEGKTLPSSCEILILAHDSFFDTDPASNPRTILATAGNADVLFGDIGRFRIPDHPIGIQDAYSLGVNIGGPPAPCLPEPSTAATLFLATLLAFKRKR